MEHGVPNHLWTAQLAGGNTWHPVSSRNNRIDRENENELDLLQYIQTTNSPLKWHKKKCIKIKKQQIHTMQYAFDSQYAWDKCARMCPPVNWKLISKLIYTIIIFLLKCWPGGFPCLLNIGNRNKSIRRFNRNLLPSKFWDCSASSVYGGAVSNRSS